MHQLLTKKKHLTHFPTSMAVLMNMADISQKLKLRMSMALSVVCVQLLNCLFCIWFLSPLGEYRVELPDGRTQIVTYHADHETGYVADVKYEGEARPYVPEQQYSGKPVLRG